jgi:double-stranded uracil-DNA glycosylase
VLVLGTVPGVPSLAAGEYYAHPRNAFWRIAGAVFDFDPAAPYPERLELLTGNGVALWDVLHSCERRGSLDSRIRPGTEVPNHFCGFLAQNPSIRRILFNGTRAEVLFRRLVLPRLSAAAAEMERIRLPSTSPAHAAASFHIKLVAWRAALLP